MVMCNMGIETLLQVWWQNTLFD